MFKMYLNKIVPHMSGKYPHITGLELLKPTLTQLWRKKHEHLAHAWELYDIKPIDPQALCKGKGKITAKGRNECAILTIILGRELPLFKGRRK